MFLELMKISNGRLCSCSVPAFSTTSLIVTYRAWSDSGVLILYVEPSSISGRSIFSCIWMTSALGRGGGAAGVSSRDSIPYSTIF